MSRVASTSSCLIHFKGEKGPLTCFTETSFKKVLASHELWLTLDGEQREIADKTAHVLKNLQSFNYPSDMLKDVHYHRTCYSKFTNVTLIKRAQARCTREQDTSETATRNDQEMTGEDETGPARKLLRSSTSSTVNSRSQAILPPVCIVCNHEKAYFTDAVSVLLHLARRNSPHIPNMYPLIMTARANYAAANKLGPGAGCIKGLTTLYLRTRFVVN
jgi:hypothetical protein